MGANVGGGSKFVSEINVGIDVDLPQTKQVEVLPTESENMVMTVRQDGKIFLDEYAVELDDLENKLQVLVKEKNKTLFLQADKNVPYGTVVDIMGRIKAVGIEKLGVVAEKPDEAPAAGRR